MSGVVAPAQSSLRERVLRAGSWLLFGHALGQLVRLATNVVVSRLLAPEAFGLMAVVYMLMTAFALFSDTGLNRALVQSPRSDDPAFLDTAWSLQILRGAGIAALSLVVALGFVWAGSAGLTAPGSVYSDTRLPWVIAGFAPVALLQGCESVRIELARRHLQQKLLTQLELAAQVAAAGVIVAVAWWTRSFWALVVGAWVSAAVRCVFSHLALPGHSERWRFDAASRRELLAQAHWILPASMLGFVAMNADRVVLGGLIDTPTFGLYAIACLLAGAVQAVIGNLLGNVVYPALSEVARQAPGRVLATLERFQILFDRAVVTGAGFLAMTGPLIVGLLYDPRYAPAGWMLSALAIGLIGLRSQVVEQAYLPLGKPQVMTLTMALRAVGLVLASSLGYRWGGLEMAVYGIAACTFLTWPVALWFKAGLGRLNWRLELHFLPFALLGGGLGWASSAGFALLRH